MPGSRGQLGRDRASPPQRPAPYLEVRNLVASPQRDLEYIHGADESREPCQTLLAAPPYANQQSVSPRALQDAIDVAAEGGKQRHRALIRLPSTRSRRNGPGEDGSPPCRHILG